MRREDRESAQRILFETQKFTEDEIRIAMETIDVYLNSHSQKDYFIFSAVLGNESIAGFINFGPVPVTEGTYDIYWIAVDPACQGQGVGTVLVNFVEEKMKEMEGRMVCVETSSTGQYSLTQKFYEKLGYVLESRIPDFYRAGDDRLTYVKRLNTFM
jgi:ribosomal protein S18 acetylase RimI-like enzyme